jgi:WD40 repeat protein
VPGTSGSEVLFFRFGEESLCEYSIRAADLSFGTEPTDIVAACSHPSGALTLLVAGCAGYLVTWDMRARTVSRKFVGAGTGAELRQAAWSPDAKHVVAAYADGVIQLWAADDGKAVLSRLAAGRTVTECVCVFERERACVCVCACVVC